MRREGGSRHTFGEIFAWGVSKGIPISIDSSRNTWCLDTWCLDSRRNNIAISWVA